VKPLQNIYMLYQFKSSRTFNSGSYQAPGRHCILSICTVLCWIQLSLWCVYFPQTKEGWRDRV